MKIDENSYYSQRNTSYLLHDSRNFNELFRKDVTYNPVRKGVSAPSLFLRHPSLDPACPLFKIFVSPLIFSVPLLFKVFEIVSLTLTQPLPALIRPTNLPWFKQISKGRFYKFTCRFLLKINF